MKLQPGVHKDVPPLDYHDWRFDFEHPENGPISNSLLKKYAALGPLKFRHAEQDTRTAAMTWGGLVDCLLFTPSQFDNQFIDKALNPYLSDDGGVRSKAAKEWRDDAADRGLALIDEETLENAQKAVDRLNWTPAAASLLDGADFQVALSQMPDHGVPVKGLLDVVPNNPDELDCLGDLKTTAANIYSDDELGRAVGKFGYHIQGALYLHLWNNLSEFHGGEKRTRWKIIWQSSKAPYETRVTELDNLWMDAGKAFIRYHMPRLIRDIRTGTWNSPFSHQCTILPMHSPSVFAEENTMEMLASIEI